MMNVRELQRQNILAWERRGRGVLTFEDAVTPRPPFAPFPGHTIKVLATGDDGVRHTTASGFFSKLKAMIRGEDSPPALPASGEEEDAIEPEWMPPSSHPLELVMRLPAAMAVKPEHVVPLLNSLSMARLPIAFEILATADDIRAQWVVEQMDAAEVMEQLTAHFPEVKVVVSNNSLPALTSELAEAAMVEFALESAFMLPLATVSHDPFVSLIGALASLHESEVGLYQVIFTPLDELWANEALAAVTRPDGRPMFECDAALVKGLPQKMAGQLYGVVVRLAAFANDLDQAWRIVRRMAAALRHYTRHDGNALLPLNNEDYPHDEHREDALYRRSRRCGMLLNQSELAGLVHLPGAAVLTSKFKRLDTSTRVASLRTRNEGVCLGINRHDGEANEVWLSPEQRVRHCHILGGTGTGKSTLLLSMIQQDLMSGQGIAVLDPHGDLIDRVLGIMPPERLGDVVLFDPADEQFVIPFNILSAHSDFEKQLLASDLVSVFQRLSTSWGDQMNSVFQNAVLAFLESREGGTLADLRRFLLDARWRERFLQTVSDPDVVFYWQRAFPQLGSGKSIGPIITRLETFLSPKPIRYMVSQNENRLDFGAIMDGGKIFLARLPQGQIGRENAFLLGSLVMTKLQQMAMSRARVPAAQRRPFYCYIDEFHHFITPSLTEILSGARKYGLGLVLAHQDLRQLDRDKEVGSAVLSNSLTRVVFRVGDADARTLADGFAHFEARHLQSLGIGQAIARIERADNDFNLEVPMPPELDEALAAEQRMAATQASRASYALPRQAVEAMLQEKEKAAEPAPKPAREPRPKAPEPVGSEPVAPALVPPTVVEPAPPATTPVPQEPRQTVPQEAGKGGHQHRHVQDRIRAVGEQMGFRAMLEMPVSVGRESIDVGLLRHDMRIACEISVTTTIDHEVGNVRKCLRENFDLIAVITSEERRLRQIEAAVVGCFTAEESGKVRYFQPDAFLAYLGTLTPPPEPPSVPSAPAPQESVRKGYKVKRVFAQLTPEERQQRENTAIKLIAYEMKMPSPPSE